MTTTVEAVAVGAVTAPASWKVQTWTTARCDAAGAAGAAGRLQTAADSGLGRTLRGWYAAMAAWRSVC